MLGYTTQFSFHYDCDDGKDPASSSTTRASWCVPIRSASPRRTTSTSYYLGWTGEGHIGWLNVSHAFYQALGHDTLEPDRRSRASTSTAQLAFLELSIDRDWMRYQTSVFYSSGDGDPRDGTARGFDSILDNPQIMGGELQLLEPPDASASPTAAASRSMQREQRRPRPAQLSKIAGPGELRESRHLLMVERRRDGRADAEAAVDRQRQLPPLRRDRRRSRSCSSSRTSAATSAST